MIVADLKKFFTSVTLKTKKRLKVEKTKTILWRIIKQKTEKQKTTNRQGITEIETETENKVIKTNKAMKTKNNVQKTVLRTAAVLVSFVLISLTVTAQEFWKTVLTNSSFNQIALAMAETPKKPGVSVSTDEKSLNNEMYLSDYDSKLNLEDWMTDNNNFSAAEIQKVEKDENLKVEDWMLNQDIISVSTETESPLTVESWMTESKTWLN